jgi:ferrochelatase
MGGPGNLSEIPEYLYNIFSDRTLIQLPGGRLLQKPFAHMISRLRSKRVQQNYERIGGNSPLLKWTRAQADHIERLSRSSSRPVTCYIGMRYFRPTISQAIDRAYDDGFRNFLFLPMYPQYSRATTGSSFKEASRAGDRKPNTTASYIKDFHNHPGYISLLRDYITANIGESDTLLFSAHSLPQRYVDEGDPYVDQIMKTASLAAGERKHYVSFQSRTGPVKWVGPDTVSEAKRLLREDEGDLFIVPISFVCDHIETLYEIDIELKEAIAGTDQEATRVKRMPMFNDDPRFAKLLTEIIHEKLYSHAVD